MTRRKWDGGRACRLAVVGLALHGAWAPADAAPPGASAVSHGASGASAHAAAPTDAFFVEWRIAPASGAGSGGAQVITSRSAATGTSGFGQDANVVGTAAMGSAQGAVQGVRVANGRAASLLFDRAESRTVVDLSWASRGGAPAGGVAANSSGAATHDEVVHRVRGLRVVPHWTRGDTLGLELSVVRPAGASGEDGLALDTTIDIRFGDWMDVAHLDQGEALQVRVSRR